MTDQLINIYGFVDNMSLQLLKRRRGADFNLESFVGTETSGEPKYNYYTNGAKSLYKKDSTMVRNQRASSFNNFALPHISVPPLHFEIDTVLNVHRNMPGLERAKKGMIEYFFLLFGMPSEAECSDWVIDEIMRRAGVLSESKRCTEKTLQDIRISYLSAGNYDFISSRRSQGPKFIFSDSSIDGLKLIQFFQSKMPIAQATYMINELREARGEKRVSMSTVQAFTERSTYCSRYLVKSKCQGKNDAESDWAKARLVFAEEIVARYRLGDITPPSLAVDFYSWDDDTLKPLWNVGTFFCDESHANVQTGPQQKYLINVSIDEHGDPCSIENGGFYPDECFRIDLKYPG